MLDSFLFGLLAASSLAVGGLLAAKFKLSSKILGLIMAFGVGALISSVSFELIEDAFDYANDLVVVTFGILCGALTYFILDFLVDKFGTRNAMVLQKTKNNLDKQFL